MRHRRIPVLSRRLCAVMIAVFGFLPGVRLFAQQAATAGTQARLDQLQAILKKAEAEGDGLHQAGALLAIGEVYLFTGDSQTAMENFSRALPIVQRLGLKQGEAMVLLDMGGACREAGRDRKAPW